MTLFPELLDKPFLFVVCRPDVDDAAQNGEQLFFGVHTLYDGSPAVIYHLALLVPEESTKEHLEILAQLAGMFASEPFCARLRASDTDRELYDLLSHWEASRETA